MKMRVCGNSIRLRLTQSEVARFAETGSVTETIEFGVGSELVYGLRSSSAAEHAAAEFDSEHIIITVPKDAADRWVNSDDEGIAAKQEIGGGRALDILIEKDFACLTPRQGEQDRDTFPHPRGSKEC